MLAVALAAALAGLAAVLLTGTAPGSSAGAPVTRPPTHPAVASTAHKPPAAHNRKPARPVTSSSPASALPPAAAAAAAFVGDLQAAVADGQMAQPAGQDLFNHLQQTAIRPARPEPQQIQQQYQQLVQSYDQHLSQGQITGPAAASLRRDLGTLGTAVAAT